MLDKKTILRIKNIYTAHAFQVNGEVFVGAGSETDPDVRLCRFGQSSEEKIPDCPGGMMSFIPVPGSAGSYVSIMGLFPPFIGGEAGLFLHQFSDGGWRTVKAMNLPFAHRCEFIRKGDDLFLAAATVSRYKENPADWSQPGELHIIHMTSQKALPWSSEVLAKKLFRNHGMCRIKMHGTEVLCISGAEGIFAIQPDTDAWQLVPIIQREVSEMSFMDLDGDGIDELVTIEPFHGETLCIYKHDGKDWHLRYSDSLSFGHGLSTGFFMGKPRVVVGNRAGSLALEMFSVDNLDQGALKREVIESEAGPTQTQVFKAGKKEYILSANQRKHEVAIYSGMIDGSTGQG